MDITPMAEENKYKDIQQLITELARYSDSMKSGELSADDLQSMADDARELYERIVVIRHMAFDKIVKSDEQENEVGEPPVMPFRINMKSAAISKNQTSLIDVIEELTSDSSGVEDTDENEVEESKVSTSTQEDEAEQEDAAPKSPEAENANPNSPEDSADEEDSTPPFKPADTPIEEASTEETHDDVEEALASEIEPKEASDSEPSLQESGSVNERISLSTESRQTVADRLKKSPVADLKKAIGLNQKFQFINELFEGDSIAYDEAIEILNSADNWDEAREYFENTLVADNDWEEDHPSVIDFRELVERRYL